MIRPDVMQNFVNAFAGAGFQANSFNPSYGLAEATLAVTVLPPGGVAAAGWKAVMRMENNAAG